MGSTCLTSDRRCGSGMVLLLLISACGSEATAISWRRASVNTSIYTLQAYSSAVTVRSRITCAGLCSQNPGCHVFSFRTEANQCLLSPVLARRSPTMSVPLTDVYFDGVMCPFNTTYQVAGFTSCFKVYQTKLTIANARKVCENDGTTVVTMKTEEKSSLLVTFIYLTTGLGNVWLEASDPSHTNHWLWPDSHALDLTHPLWQPREPEGGKYCLIANYYLGKYMYNDVYCDSRTNEFVCEIVLK